MTAVEDTASSKSSTRLVRRRIQLVVEYWEDPDAIGVADLAVPDTYLDAHELQLYRVLQVQAGTAESVAYRPYELRFVARSSADCWDVHDPTPRGTGYVPPVFTGTHAECTAWVLEQGGTVVRR